VSPRRWGKATEVFAQGLAVPRAVMVPTSRALSRVFQQHAGVTLAAATTLIRDLAEWLQGGFKQQAPLRPLFRL